MLFVIVLLVFIKVDLGGWEGIGLVAIWANARVKVMMTREKRVKPIVNEVRVVIFVLQKRGLLTKVISRIENF